VKRQGKSLPVLMVTLGAVHLMGCKAMYISINLVFAKLPALFLSERVIVEKGRPLELSSNVKSR